MNEPSKTTTPVSEATRILDKPSVEANEEEEAPAVEGLLLLQHMAGSTESVPQKRSSLSDSMDTFPSTPENPVHVLLKKGIPMRVALEIHRLEMFRGVFVHTNPSIHYSIIKRGDELHFLGFHASSVAAAHAWDLAALKRAMDGDQNLSNAKTNFRLEDYVRLESLFSMMLVLTFEELIEMIKDSNRLTYNDSEMKEVQDRMHLCRAGFKDEIGNAVLTEDLKDDRPYQILNGNVLSPDQMRDLISATCTRTQHNAWVKNIRDSKKWKGVYFSTDGVPYSKVEFGGKYHYLGRFDTLEGAARAYDLATLKRAMINNQSIVSLNFPAEDYTKDRKLMEYLHAAGSEEVSSFIRMLAQNQRSSMVGDYSRGRMASKRQKLDAMEPMGRKLTESSVQHIDWDSMGLGKVALSQPPQPLMEREEPMESTRKAEMKVERRICDSNMAAMLRDSKDWVKVALNAVALKMSPANLTVTAEAAVFPRDVSEWFGVSTNLCGSQCIELINACGTQRFKFNCHISRDRCQFSSLDWNHFVDAVGLTVGDILVLLRCDAMWKLNYTVFVLPDTVMTGPLASHMMHDIRSLSRSAPSGQLPPSYVVRPPTQPQLPTRRTVQAHVLPNARSLTSIQVIQTAQDGRLLVYAGHINDPSNRSFYVIPANSVSEMPTLRPFSGIANTATHPQAFANKRCLPGMLGTVLPAVRPPIPQTPLPTRPACSHSAPIRLNVRGGFKTLDKKTDANLYMVTDTNGQMRLVTSQPMRMNQPGRPTPEPETAVGYPSHYISKTPNRPQPVTADRLSQTSPEITVIDPSTTGSDASGTGTEKPLHEDSTTKHVIDLVEEEEKDPPSKEGLPTMYAQVMKILEECRGLDADIVKKYKFVFINKMPNGQQAANLMELKNLSASGRWTEVTEWIRGTVKTFDVTL